MVEISLLGSERAWAGNRPGYSTPQTEVTAVEIYRYAASPWLVVV